MKYALVAIALAIIGYIVWDNYRPLKIDGPSIPGDRVLALEEREQFSITDLLEKGGWVLFLFVDDSEESGRVTRQFEATVRERNDKVRLVIVNVGSTASPVATRFELKSLPAAWLYHGTTRRSADTAEILEALGR